MTLVLPIIGVAFAAFCVWLTVRVINRRERWARWTLAIAIGPLMYVASFGPACWLVRHECIEPLNVAKVYAPMIRCVPAWPPAVSQPDSIFEFFRWYSGGTISDLRIALIIDEHREAFTDYLIIDPPSE